MATTVSKMDAPSKLPEKEYNAISNALLSHIVIKQMNGKHKQSKSSLQNLLKDLFKKSGKTCLIKDYRHLWRKIERDNAAELDISNVLTQECNRIFWTTYLNLNQWFDSWELFCMYQGFATRNSDGALFFPVEQRRRIINLDETKFSVDGSGGVVGGRPALFITV